MPRIRLPGARAIFSSIRFRLTAWYLLILAVVLLVFGIIVYATQADSTQARMRETLRQDAQRLAGLYNPATAQIELPNVPKKDVFAGQNDLLLIFDSQGNLLDNPSSLNSQDVDGLLQATKAGFAREKAAYDVLVDKLLAAGKATPNAYRVVAPAPGSLTAGLASAGGIFFDYSLVDAPPGASDTRPDFLFYSIPLLVKSDAVGMFMLGRLREDQAEMQRLLMALLLAAPATLLLAAAGGYWLSTRAMRPVRAITRTAREIGETDLHRRLNMAGQDEIGELAGTFDGMLDRLEGAFSRQRQFTADASHELRTPLTIVGLETGRALAVRRSPEEYERALTTIQAENEYMSRLVSDLLTLARADAGRASLRHEEVDLSDIALEVVERLEPLARARGVDLTTGELPELRITGDPFYLGQMLSNLVENGIKHAGGPGRWLRVEAGSTPDDKKPLAWVRVEDNGPGIAPEHLPHLFDRFYRVDKARSKTGDEANEGEGTPGGSGLGLSIARWVALAHGGDITVQSDVGTGSTFAVLLPLSQNGTDRHVHDQSPN